MRCRTGAAARGEGRGRFHRYEDGELGVRMAEQLPARAEHRVRDVPEERAEARRRDGRG
ncbi:hypothetical protein ACFXA3_03405 [Streptomyces sp. NPDC059456]|uniref:hypothetical protein n=1 Tax=Streptomyces sp. NPDC059456 TaxID=3346838 RepID=UPI003694F7DB